MAADLTTETLRGPEPPASVDRLTAAQTAEIGALCWRSYPAGEAGASEAESVADIAASFAGVYGTLFALRHWEPSSTAGSPRLF